MRIDIITSVPELLTSPLHESILKRAQDKGLVEIVVHNLHDYAHDRRKTTLPPLQDFFSELLSVESVAKVRLYFK